MAYQVLRVYRDNLVYKVNQAKPLVLEVLCEDRVEILDYLVMQAYRVGLVYQELQVYQAHQDHQVQMVSLDYEVIPDSQDQTVRQVLVTKVNVVIQVIMLQHQLIQCHMVVYEVLQMFKDHLVYVVQMAIVVIKEIVVNLVIWVLMVYKERKEKKVK